MTAQIAGRIGKWTARAALEDALEKIGNEDPLIIVTISEEDKQMRFWSANANNMQANWMADNVKAEVLGGDA